MAAPTSVVLASPITITSPAAATVGISAVTSNDAIILTSFPVTPFTDHLDESITQWSSSTFDASAAAATGTTAATATAATSPSGARAGAVVPAVLVPVLCLAALLGFWWLRRRHRRGAARGGGTGGDGDLGTGTGGDMEEVAPAPARGSTAAVPTAPTQTMPRAAELHVPRTPRSVQSARRIRSMAERSVSSRAELAAARTPRGEWSRAQLRASTTEPPVPTAGRGTGKMGNSWAVAENGTEAAGALAEAKRDGMADPRTGGADVIGSVAELRTSRTDSEVLTLPRSPLSPLSPMSPLERVEERDVWDAVGR